MIKLHLNLAELGCLQKNFKSIQLNQVSNRKTLDFLQENFNSAVFYKKLSIQPGLIVTDMCFLQKKTLFLYDTLNSTWLNQVFFRKMYYVFLQFSSAELCFVQKNFDSAFLQQVFYKKPSIQASELGFIYETFNSKCPNYFFYQILNSAWLYQVL